MGNRAIVKQDGSSLGVYLHWNGGPSSVTAFLKYCELKQYRGFHDTYGLARFCQVVGNYFGGGLSIGIEDGILESSKEAEYLDNGIYVVRDWEIVRHIGASYDYEKYNLELMLKYIDAKQPEEERLGDFLDGIETPISEIKKGDIVFVPTLRGTYEKRKVIGIGREGYVNGRNIEGIPYVDKWDTGPNNINNYLTGKTVRVYKGVEPYVAY